MLDLKLFLKARVCLIMIHYIMIILALQNFLFCNLDIRSDHIYIHQ
jgi:hypothetical protein